MKIQILLAAAVLMTSVSSFAKTTTVKAEAFNYEKRESCIEDMRGYLGGLCIDDGAYPMYESFQYSVVSEVKEQYRCPRPSLDYMGGCYSVGTRTFYHCKGIMKCAK